MPASDLPTPIAAEEIFRAAVALPAAERAAYLDAACAVHPELRARVERMLEVGGIAAFLRQPADETVPPEIAAELARLKPEEGGERIGNYKLIEQIGEGGFGVVWMAEQEQPVRRRVALKIIKLGMDTKEVIARFEQERQALAMMDHPNIAKVFDAGATQHGRPFFVMELVRGIPITEYCDANNLPTAERLQLFIAVCRAVQHAHQKGIIHRDLKPSNILVTLHDGVPVPKVIDFGVAKATQSQRLTDLTLFTQFEQMIGTPLYMSPEQAERSGIDIDTRSDIYSLGVLLYELLTGRTPFDPEELMRKGYDEIRRVIREQEPQKPSTALHTMAADVRTTIANHRQVESAKLVKLIRGDLDWIVMKALEKDRSRRYETANALLLDLKRHIDNEPVLARPASAAYRFRRLVRRNKIAFSGATMGGVLLLALAAVSTLSALRLREQRNEIDESLGRAYLAQARAQRLSSVPGRRGESLRALAEAARIRPSIEVRNEAVAALALADLGPPVAWREATPENHTHEIMLSPDGDRYAIFGAREGITLYRRQDGEVLSQLTTPPDMVFFGRFSPDGRWLVAYDTKQRVFFWDLTRPGPGPHAPSTAILESSNYCAEFTPDSRAVAIAGRDRQFHLFDLPTGAESLRFDLGMTARPLKFDPAGKLIALTAGRELRIWDIDRRQVVAQRSHESIGTEIAWHPHGRFVAVGWENGDILLYDSAIGSSRWLPPHMQNVSSLAFDPRGEFLVSASWDGMQRFWDPPTGRLLFETKDGEAVRLPRNGGHVVFLKDGGGIGAREIVRSGVFRTLTSARTGHPHLGGADFSPDGRWVICGGRSGLHIWNVESGREVVSVASASAERPRFHPTGRFIVTCGLDEVLRWRFDSPADGGEVRAGPPEILLSVPGGNFTEVCFTTDGEQFGVAGRRGSLVVNWSDPSQRVAFGQNLETTGDDHVSLSADHRWVAGASFHGAGVTVWDARDGSLAHRLIRTENAQIAFSPDGRTLATGTARELVLWDTATWQPRQRIASHLTGAIPAPVAFSRDGALLAIAATRHEIQLLDPRTGHPVATLTPPLPLTLTALAFSADGRYLAAQTIGPVLHLWDLQTLRHELRALGLDW